MSNRTYICTKCRTSKRAEAAGGLKTELRCMTCGGELWELSHKWRIPRKADKKAWAELAEVVEQSEPSREEFIARRGEELISKIDRQIKAFSARKPSEQRDQLLKDLAHERREIIRKYFGGEYGSMSTPNSIQTQSEQTASSNH